MVNTGAYTTLAMCAPISRNILNQVVSVFEHIKNLPTHPGSAGKEDDMSLMKDEATYSRLR